MTPDIPGSWQSQMAGFSYRQVDVGRSQAAVYKTTGPDGTEYFLKRCPVSTDPDPGKSLWAEAERLKWLFGKFSCPKLVSFTIEDGLEYLLMSAVLGTDASVVRSRQEATDLLPLLAGALKLLHNLPTDDCSFDQRLDAKLGQAKLRIEGGLVDVGNFDEKRQGMTAQELYAMALNVRPTSEDLVVCHGDFCLPNIITNLHKVTGLIDLGRLGIADRYQDLALMIRSISAPYNPLFGPELALQFCQLYGIENPDLSKIEYYMMLDEFF